MVLTPEIIEHQWNELLIDLHIHFGRRPDLQSVLFLIGVQELGQLRKNFTKEEKQDLMHIAVCKLLADDGYFSFSGHDDDGWPHYTPIKSLPIDQKGLEEQENLLKKQILKYFEKI